jgi:hypothetical protein
VYCLLLVRVMDTPSSVSLSSGVGSPGDSGRLVLLMEVGWATESWVLFATSAGNVYWAGSSKPFTSSGYFNIFLPEMNLKNWPKGASRMRSAMWGSGFRCKTVMSIRMVTLAERVNKQETSTTRVHRLVDIPSVLACHATLTSPALVQLVSIEQTYYPLSQPYIASKSNHARTTLQASTQHRPVLEK